jgi:hypothetical protein
MPFLQLMSKFNVTSISPQEGSETKCLLWKFYLAQLYRPLEVILLQAHEHSKLLKYVTVSENMELGILLCVLCTNERLMGWSCVSVRMFMSETA